MIETLLVLALGLTPPILSLCVMRRAEVRARQRLEAVIEATADRMQSAWFPLDQGRTEGVGYLVGDISCRFNARSAYLRCAVNPLGPCQECPHYESKTISRAEL